MARRLSGLIVGLFSVLWASVALAQPIDGADTLPFRAFFGMAGQPIDGQPGLNIGLVMDGATASRAGIVVGDRLLSVNGRPVETMPQLVAISSGYVEGQAIDFVIMRAGEETTLSTQAVGRPKETSENYDVIYDQVEVATGTSRSIIYKPRGAGPFPAIYYLQGFGCGSVDHGLFPIATSRQLLEAFAEAGFVTFRMERPGVGDSISSVSCGDMDYPTELDAFKRGYETLGQYDFVDTENLFMFGHSLGGVNAPFIANEMGTKGIVTYGSVAKPWFEYMIDVVREQPVLLGVPYREIQRQTALAIPFFYDLMVAQERWSKIEKRHAEAIAEISLPIQGQRIIGRDYTYWAGLNDLDIVNAWVDYQGKMLAIYGTYDFEAISADGATHAANIVNANHPGNGSALVLDGAEHWLSRIEGDFTEFAKLKESGGWSVQMGGETFDARIADETIQWMRAVMEEEG